MFSCCCTETVEDSIQAIAVVSHNVLTSEPLDMEQFSTPFLRSEARRSQRPSMVFEAILRKEDPTAPFGWHVDTLHGKGIFISTVLQDASTVVSRYNLAAPQKHRIQEGDFLMAINGVSGSANDMAQELRVATSLLVTIHRPERLRATCRKQGESLGLDLKYSVSSKSLHVGSIREGGVAQRLLPDLRAGDRIVKVNGVRGTAVALLQLLTDQDELEVTWMRMPSFFSETGRG
mmetsp:Transcript_84646/g.244657  ORF Transcript_84646/g.244657 Transcript_84646/m.244657 type:complete len:233 (+) Transcript_84646:63-761(+)